MLFAYWDALRGERAAPERGDVRPAEMRHILADTFVLALDDARIATFRLAGTRCRALFGRDLAATPLHGLWPEGDRPDVDRLVDLVVADTVGVVAGLLGTNENRSEVALELLLLPLRHRGRTEARVIGALSPASIPSWAGLVPVRSVETRSLRVIEPGRTAPATSRPEPAELESAARRRLFVVHDGGRV